MPSTNQEPMPKGRVVSLLQENADRTMIKEMISRPKPDVDRMHLSGHLDALVDAGMLESNQVSSAKRYRLNPHRQAVLIALLVIALNSSPHRCCRSCI